MDTLLRFAVGQATKSYYHCSIDCVAAGLAIRLRMLPSYCSGRLMGRREGEGMQCLCFTVHTLQHSSCAAVCRYSEQQQHTTAQPLYCSVCALQHGTGP
eukprot:228-Heterococcus_DN1.PRE.1